MLANSLGIRRDATSVVADEVEVLCCLTCTVVKSFRRWVFNIGSRVGGRWSSKVGRVAVSLASS